MLVAGIFGPVLFAPAVAIFILDALNGVAAEASALVTPSLWQSVLATAVIVISTDFCKYWSHRLHHQTGFLWPFHSVHHSAEVLTPLTLARIPIRRVPHSHIVISR